ncbi:MAG: hypothetical protein UU67_C0047G0004 [Candidatus Daviesbacteria bacterium GW2011_GWB1_41_5]|uniref:Uncharacterized protein n=1 Tax=Candidatus Daviesbacteria bacterium GW2011_GWB1_41_5 TaxID=1618429 RepID=A0A0G0WKR3_9BACT|nr:MAG: hypothetical protein UU67_C0047G0004 [Candidatus Daviesbacteria bacterium GW2011_GWB1_41_5]
MSADSIIENSVNPNAVVVDPTGPREISPEEAGALKKADEIRRERKIRETKAQLEGTPAVDITQRTIAEQQEAGKK